LLEHFGPVHRFSFRLDLDATPVMVRLIRPTSPEGQPTRPNDKWKQWAYSSHYAMVTQYYVAGIGLKARGCVNGVASCSRIWPITKQRSEDRVNDPRLPVRSGPWHCRDARRRAAIFLVLALHWLESSSNSRATPTRAFRITSAHHQTVFSPPFMTASAPPLPLMIVNNGTRWLPEPETFGSKSGRGATLGTASWPNSRNPSVGIQMVCEPGKRVESSIE